MLYPPEMYVGMISLRSLFLTHSPSHTIIRLYTYEDSPA